MEQRPAPALASAAGAGAGAGASLLDLPDEILADVLQLAGLPAAWPARRACRRLRAAVEGRAWGGELRAAGAADAEGPPALERLAALVRAGRLGICALNA
eukprot:tig00000215_g18576.t1